MGQLRKRRKHKFELNISKSEESELHNRLEMLRKTRQLLPTMRDALTLLFSLQDGRIDVLAAMFPDLIEVLHREGSEQEQQRYHEEHNRKLAELHEMIASVNTLKLHMETGQTAVKPLMGGPKPLAAPKLAPPKYDDEDAALIAIRNDTSTESAMNFLKSAFALQQ